MASLTTSLPPGPETSPSQQARQWIERPLELLDACALQFGDVFTLQLGALGSTVMFSHPEAVRTIFRSPPHLFECQHFNESYRFVMGDHALFLLDGERHRQIKRTMAPPLCHEGTGDAGSRNPRDRPRRWSRAGRSIGRSRYVR